MKKELNKKKVSDPYRDFLESMDSPDLIQHSADNEEQDISLQKTLIILDNDSESSSVNSYTKPNTHVRGRKKKKHKTDAITDNVKNTDTVASSAENSVFTAQAIINSADNMNESYFNQPTQDMFLDENDVLVRVGTSSVIGRRKYQQDSIAVPSDDKLILNGKRKLLCALSDGMGGLSGGELASAVASECIINDFYQKIWQVNNSDYQKFFKDVSHKINDSVLALRDSEGRQMRAGATLIAAIIDDDNLYTLNIGDSRIYLIRNNQIFQLSHDQNYYSKLLQMVADGEISLEEADMHPKKEALISYCGIKELNLIEVNSEPIKVIAGDVILLCSDGLYRLLSNEEMVSIISGVDDMKYLAYQLTNAANRKEFRGQDNTSVITIKIFKGE